MSLKVTRENLVALPTLAPYFGLGLVAFLSAPAFLLWGAESLETGLYRHPRLLAAVHVYALGWGTAVALGALQQMVPVVFNTVLYRPRLARWAYFIYVVGLVALLVAFSTLSRRAFWTAALGVPLGVLLALVNVLLTLRTGELTPRGKLVEPFLKAAITYLLAAVLAGAALALNLATGWLGPSWNAVFPIHVVATAGGWFLMLIAGISYHLLTFFGLTDKKLQFQWPASVRRLLHFGVGVSVVAAALPAAGFSLSSAPASVLALLSLAAAAGLFIWDARDLYVPRSRERMHPLVGYIRVAHAYLALGAVGLVAAGVAGLSGGLDPSWVSALGMVLAAGWLSHTVLGYLHRILPFFVWHNRYWGRGRQPGVPAFRDMIHQPTAWIGLAIYNAGVIGTIAGLLTSLPLTPCLWILALGGALAAGNLLLTLVR